MDAYAERQAARDREYLEACKAAGITPDLPTYQLKHRKDDSLALSLASEPVEEELPAQVMDHDRERELMIQILLWVTDGANASQIAFKAKAGLWAISPMLAGGQDNIAQLASQFGYTRAAGSKTLRSFRDRFGVNVVQTTKPLNYRKICKTRAHKVWSEARKN